MDLSIKLDDYKLNIRTCGIIIHNGKVLLHRDINSDHYALIGGRIRLGEDSAEAVKREILEETGKEVIITGYIATIENFFKMKEFKYHELLFVHKVEFVNEEDKKIEEIIKNIEGRKELQYEWIKLEELDSVNVLPAIIKEALKNKDLPVHIINNELK